jgi:hypothetical protein
MATSGKNPFLKIKTDDLESMQSTFKALTEMTVLVGFPEDTTQRTDESVGNREITNAALGYIHDTGMPEQNIPARPFMIPGMNEVEDKVADQLTSLAKKALTKRIASEVIKGWERVGVIAMTGLKRKINEGIPPPLAESTLRKRGAKGDAGSLWELAWREAGAEPGTDTAKPLIVTGQLRNAINYVIRKRKGK